jgi:hypothetical protein
MTGQDRSPDVLATLLCNAVGIALLIASWVAASGQPAVGPQLPYVNLGVAGVIMAGAGDALYLHAMTRVVTRRRARLQQHRRLAKAGRAL